MQIDPSDPVFESRGISPETVRDRGYVRWSANDYQAVMEEAFAGLSDGGIRWLQQVVSRDLPMDEIGGIIIARQSPLEAMFNGGRFMPEIRPDAAVQTGHPQRHFHGEELGSLFELLPSIVLESFCLPQLGGWRVLKFHHNHDDLSSEEAYGHQLVWHSGAHKKVHWHSLKVFPPRVVKDHILSDSGKISGPHSGVNDQAIHQHIPKAKYLFPPSAKEDHKRKWSEDSQHDHSRMNPSELEWHLDHHHPEEGGGVLSY